VSGVLVSGYQVQRVRTVRIRMYVSRTPASPSPARQLRGVVRDAPHAKLVIFRLDPVHATVHSETRLRRKPAVAGSVAQTSQAPSRTFSRTALHFALSRNDDKAVQEIVSRCALHSLSRFSMWLRKRVHASVVEGAQLPCMMLACASAVIFVLGGHVCS
jgi:hypothetical protein